MLIYDKKHPYNIFEQAALIGTVCFALYEFANAFIPNKEMLIYVRVIGLSCYAVSLWIFAPDAWIGLFHRPARPRDFVICAIWLKFFGEFLFSIYSLIFRLAHEPEWLLTNELLFPILLLGPISVYLHLNTPGGNGEGVPRRNRYAMGIGVGLALLLLGLTAVSMPNIAPIVNEACPYIGDWFGTEARDKCPALPPRPPSTSPEAFDPGPAPIPYGSP